MSCRINLLRVGHCVVPEVLTARGAPLRPARFPALVAVIRHPDLGNILFDTGYGRSFFKATASFPERLYRWLTPVRLPAAEELPRQLAPYGAPDLILLSHLHGDHIAGLDDLDMSCPILTSAKALEGLAKPRVASLRAGCPAALRDAVLARDLHRIEDRPAVDLAPYGLESLGEGRDIAGDGSLIAIPLPGHGIGQFGLYLPQTDKGEVFLIADAAWSLRALLHNRPPPKPTLRNLGDAEAYLDTFARLRALAIRRPDLRLIASHCIQNFGDMAR